MIGCDLEAQPAWPLSDFAYFNGRNGTYGTSGHFRNKLDLVFVVLSVLVYHLFFLGRVCGWYFSLASLLGYE